MVEMMVDQRALRKAAKKAERMDDEMVEHLVDLLGFEKESLKADWKVDEKVEQKGGSREVGMAELLVVLTASRKALKTVELRVVRMVASTASVTAGTLVDW